jgi:hypothetical protein
MALKQVSSATGKVNLKPGIVPSGNETCKSSYGQVSLASWKGLSRVGKGQSSFGVCLSLHEIGQSSVGTGQSRITCQYTGASGQVSLAPEKASIASGSV